MTSAVSVGADMKIDKDIRTQQPRRSSLFSEDKSSTADTRKLFEDVMEFNRMTAMNLAIQKSVTDLFQELSGRMPEGLQYSMKLAGSVGEGTKVGRYDEFDIQLQMDALSAIVQRVHVGYTGNAEIMVKLNGKMCERN